MTTLPASPAEGPGVHLPTLMRIATEAVDQLSAANQHLGAAVIRQLIAALTEAYAALRSTREERDDAWAELDAAVSRYLSAVQGRREFRRALAKVREEVKSLPAFFPVDRGCCAQVADTAKTLHVGTTYLRRVDVLAILDRAAASPSGAPAPTPTCRKCGEPLEPTEWPTPSGETISGSICITEGCASLPSEPSTDTDDVADARRWRWFRQFMSVESETITGQYREYLYLNDDGAGDATVLDGYGHTVEELVDARIAASLPSEPSPTPEPKRHYARREGTSKHFCGCGAWIPDELRGLAQHQPDCDRAPSPDQKEPREIGGCSCGARFYSHDAMDAHRDLCPLPEP